MKKSRFTEEQTIQVLQLAGSGKVCFTVPRHLSVRAGTGWAGWSA
jgi:hypothetical protein